jgi:hypothetical protein
MPVVSVISGGPDPVAAVLPELVGYFGPVALQSGEYPFDMSSYYLPEMGEHLKRIWLCFTQLKDPSELPVWKIHTRGLEDSLSRGGRRTVNLDPGYLDHGKLVLASFKEAPDKVYMAGGVWAHTCLRYRFGDFTGPDHSFPDFLDGRFNEFFRRAKGMYRKLLRGQSDNVDDHGG